jgi:hypothetical protein
MAHAVVHRHVAPTISILVFFGRSLKARDLQPFEPLGDDRWSANYITHPRLGDERTAVVLVDFIDTVYHWSIYFVGVDVSGVDLGNLSKIK